MTCRMREGYYATHPEHREANGEPPGPLGHVWHGVSRRLIDGEWVEVERHCSWCGKPAPTIR